MIKEGTFTLIFHPHGWIKSNQVNELIDHAVSEHGRKAKFLNFREIKARLDQNLLDGHALRAKDGSDNGVRLIDLNNDSYMDVVIANHKTRQTRVWSPEKGRPLHSDILDFGCRVAVTEQKLYLSGASVIIGDLKLPTSVAGPVRIG